MTYQTLISTEALAQNLDNPNWAIIDCRFALAEPDLGRREYAQNHIPRALYAHLDDDLSGPIVPGQTGRHPLPEIPGLAQTLSRWGIDSSTQVVAYDSMGGAMAAARLWWLLHWLGHGAVAVLNGGWPKWQAEGRPTSELIVPRQPKGFVPQLRPELLVDAVAVEELCTNPAYRLFDAREPERYRGEIEPIDPVAGHIPGAISLPNSGNLAEDLSFLPADRLNARFAAGLGNVPAERAVFYCGSGVTAAHNLLALAYAGLGEGRLYAGSWSEWITDPERPVAQG